MRKRQLLLIIFLLGISNYAFATDKDMSIRLGLGTDVSLGLAYSAGIRFFADNLEFGPDFYVSSTEWHDDRYKETTDISVLAFQANIRSPMHKPSRYLLYGIGAAAVNVYWVESSESDTSLGTPCCNGGSKHDFEGTVFGLVTNLGMGFELTQSTEMQISFPVIIIFGVNDNTLFVPTLTAHLLFNI